MKLHHENIFKKLIFKFHVAFMGIREGLSSDASLQIQFSFAFVTLFVAWFLNFTPLEWIILLICIGFVISLEFINSAFEQMLDRFDPTYHILTKRAKDLGAAAVLVASVISLIIGLMLVYNHL